MSEYKGIKGFQVQTRAEDPVPFAQQIENNPYQGAWSSGGAMNTARARGAGDGIQTAFITFSGTTPSPGTQLTNTETYNGTSFTEVNDMNTGRTDLAGTGTTTAALAATGSAATGYGTFVESWDGSSWTEITDNNTARAQLAAFGIQTATIIASGLAPPFSNLVEYWNGSSWTEVAEVNTARQGLTEGGVGVYTAGLIAGGRKAHPSYPGIETGDTESWNGSAWTEVNDLNEAKQSGGAFGTSTSAIYAGGADTGTLASTESWDGTSWTETADLATARYYSQSGGANNSSGVISGGNNAATEEWSFIGIQPTDPSAGYVNAIVGDFYYNSSTGQFKTVNDGGAPIGTWASGGNLNQPRGYNSGAGTQTAGMCISGYNPNVITNVEEYDGSSWTEVNDVNTGRSEGGGSGTQAAAIFAGGANSGGRNETELWDGTSWTEVNNLNVAKDNVQNTIGLYNAALFVGGYVPATSTRVATTESWNGTSWTEVNDLNTARNLMAEQGTQTSGLVAGGRLPSSNSTAHEQWDGTSWTESSDINTARYRVAGSGNQTAALIFAGTTYPSPPTGKTESWNGSAWTEVNDMATARMVGGAGTPAGTANATFVAGSSDPGYSAATEEFTAADFQIKSVTTS
jgi:hypothetical protein